MTAEFYREYLRAEKRKRQRLFVLNPNKFRVAEYLKDYHERQGDKARSARGRRRRAPTPSRPPSHSALACARAQIIIFSDDIYALRKYMNLLQIPGIYGGTKEWERQTILGNFRTSSIQNAICLSKVGDVAIDLPEVRRGGARRARACSCARVRAARDGSRVRVSVRACLLLLRFSGAPPRRPT